MIVYTCIKLFVDQDHLSGAHQTTCYHFLHPCVQENHADAAVCPVTEEQVVFLMHPHVIDMMWHLVDERQILTTCACVVTTNIWGIYNVLIMSSTSQLGL